jgi:hypothetical protein
VGQNLDESGVRTSSAKINKPVSVVPNSNFVSAIIIPFDNAYALA